MLICVGIPVIDGRPHAQTVDSLLAEQFLGYEQGVDFLILWEVGCSLVGVARNKIVKRFLSETPADVLVFVDSDISWKGGDLARLARRPEDVIGGTYRTKQDDVRFLMLGMPKQRGDVLKVDGIPGGFMKLSRHALETVTVEPYVDDQGQDMKNWFPTEIIGGRYYGEDYGFCRRWTDSGGEVFLDPTIHLRHHDGRRTYEGDLQAFLETL